MWQKYCAPWVFDLLQVKVSADATRRLCDHFPKNTRTHEQARPTAIVSDTENLSLFPGMRSVSVLRI